MERQLFTRSTRYPQKVSSRAIAAPTRLSGVDAPEVRPIDSGPAAGSQPATDWQLDGVNLLPHFEGKNTAAPHDALYWRFGPQWAVRQGNWKLVVGFDESANEMPPTTNPNAYKVVAAPQLYNLADDPGETKDLAAAQPDRVTSMKTAWEKWNHQNKDPLWVPNPNPAAGKAKKQKAG